MNPCCLLKTYFYLFIKSTLKTQESSDDITLNKTKQILYAQAERLLNQYGNAILQLAYSYLHNIADAEEILQDTLIQFLKTKPSLDSKEHEKAWLLKVASNLSKNRIRYNSIRKTDILMDEIVAEKREDLSFIWDAVKRLPQRYREVIHLFYHEGYQAMQIAQILGIKETTIRSRLARGRKELKKILKEAYDFE